MATEEGEVPDQAKREVMQVSETPDDVVLPKEAQERLGNKLRAYYQAIVSEPLPDKFSSLLDQLAKSERKS